MEEVQFIFDFDSTITKVEALDELVEIIAKRKNNQNKYLGYQIEDLTNKAMNGELSFDQALEERIKLLQIIPEDIENLTLRLKQKISASFLENLSFFETHQKNIFVISGGFKEYIIPVVSQLAILPNHVFANTFIKQAETDVLTFDRHNLLAQPLGKVKTLESLHLPGKIYMIGDGYTDYETKLYDVVDRFYLYAEHANRLKPTMHPDGILFSLTELITLLND